MRCPQPDRGRPVPPGDLVGRDEELALLRDRAAHGRFVLVVAPRRFGKTSLLRTLAVTADDDLAVVLVDLFTSHATGPVGGVEAVEVGEDDGGVVGRLGKATARVGCGSSTDRPEEGPVRRAERPLPGCHAAAPAVV